MADDESICYTGPFKDGEFHGKITISEDGKIYNETYFIKGVRHGKTTIYHKDWIFNGSYKNGKFDGEGVLIYAIGTKENIEFRDGRPID